MSGCEDQSVRIWDAASGQQLQQLEGHDDEVNSVSFSQDGKRIVSGSWDRSGRIWDAASGQQLQQLEGHEREVTSVGFSTDGKRIVSGSGDKSVRIWDAASGQQLQQLEGHDEGVTSVATSCGDVHLAFKPLWSSHVLCNTLIWDRPISHLGGTSLLCDCWLELQPNNPSSA